MKKEVKLDGFLFLVMGKQYLVVSNDQLSFFIL